MELHFGLVDDNKADREYLINGLHSYFGPRPTFHFSYDEFKDAESFLANYTPESYSMVFFDIQMGALSGIDLANRIREIDKDILIVFMTTSKEFAFDAFPIHPFDYLVKPFTQERLNKVLSEMIRKFADDEVSITIKVPMDSFNVTLKSIVSVTSRGHTVDVALDNGNVIRSNMKFSELEDQLSSDQRFLTCNRGIIINMDFILSADDEVFTMKNGNNYPIRVRERAKVISRYTKYMLSRIGGDSK